MPYGDGGVLEMSQGDLGGRILNDIDGSPTTVYTQSDMAGFFLDVEPFGYNPDEAIGDVFIYNPGRSHLETIGYADEWTIIDGNVIGPFPDGTPDDMNNDGTPDSPLTRHVPHSWDHLNYDYDGDGTIWNDTDADGDGTLEPELYGYIDSDGDGTADTVPDAWQVDADGDGTLDVVRYIWDYAYMEAASGRGLGLGDSTGGADSMRVAAMWPVPEPVTLTAIAAGLAGLVGSRRRRTVS
jgi:hypothetical protein